MSSKEEEYKEMFLSEALDNYEQLNELFTTLEKDIDDKDAVNAIFRITHTLKGNSMGMGFESIAELSHIMEDIFSEVKDDKLKLTKSVFDSLFKANDKLGELIDSLKTGKKVSYRGIKTKLVVILKKAKGEDKIEKTADEEFTIPPPLGSKNEDAKEKKKEDLTETNQAASEKEEVKQEQAKDEGKVEEVENSTASEPELIEEPEEIEEEEAQEEEAPKIAFSDLVQVPIRKLDLLMNQVGQLIIERDRLIAINSENGGNTSEFARLQRITSDLQYGVMDVRLVQVGFLFNKFHRIVRDVANIENKKVDLELKGTDIEIDRNILKIMSDSLIHLVRNAVSHGIEKADDRKKRGKPANGKVTLNARNEKDNVIIEVSDDGNGIDAKIIRKKIVEKGLVEPELAKQLSDDEVIMYIFEPGFSNADKITEVSGRGVGMDVVKRATESIGGQISVETEVGKGSSVLLSLPSSMAVKGALLFILNGQEYAFALSYTEAVISIYKKDIHKINNGLMTRYLDRTISLIFLTDLMSLDNLDEVNKSNVFHRTYDQVAADKSLDVIVVSYGGKFVGLVVDKLLQQKEIVEKTLTKPIDNIKLLSGTTILGNGNVCLVVDVSAITDILFKNMGNKKRKNKEVNA